MNKSNGVSLLRSDNDSMKAKYEGEERRVMSYEFFFSLFIISHRILQYSITHLTT